MGHTNLDYKIANHYAPLVLSPIKYGENGVFFWFPGSGMTTITKDIFGNNRLLQENLFGLVKQLDIIQFWGHLANTKTSKDLFKSGGFEDFDALNNHCQKIIDMGREIVLVIGRIDDFSQINKLNILKSFINIASYNPRRIHMCYMSTDKPWFEKNLLVHSELGLLANRMKLVPILSENLLQIFVHEKAKLYQNNLSRDTQKLVMNTYGGILQLTKEYIRSNGERSMLDLKFRVIWNMLPSEYQKQLENCFVYKNTHKNPSVMTDLKILGVLNLSAFKLHARATNTNPKQILPKLLTQEEFKLWKTLTDNQRRLLEKDKVASILRPENEDDISLWAIDQAISRFRKKLARAGIDPELLKTVKGKGYIWTG